MEIHASMNTIQITLSTAMYDMFVHLEHSHGKLDDFRFVVNTVTTRILLIMLQGSIQGIFTATQNKFSVSHPPLVPKSVKHKSTFVLVLQVSNVEGTAYNTYIQLFRHLKYCQSND